MKYYVIKKNGVRVRLNLKYNNPQGYGLETVLPALYKNIQGKYPDAQRILISVPKGNHESA